MYYYHPCRPCNAVGPQTHYSQTRCLKYFSTHKNDLLCTNEVILSFSDTLIFFLTYLLTSPVIVMCSCRGRRRRTFLNATFHLCMKMKRIYRQKKDSVDLRCRRNIAEWSLPRGAFLSFSISCCCHDDPSGNACVGTGRCPERQRTR